jgi:hypothetical protein
MKKRKITMEINVEITTDKDIEKVILALKKGIYRGLDTEGSYIARPNDVKIIETKEIYPIKNSILELWEKKK